MVDVASQSQLGLSWRLPGKVAFSLSRALLGATHPLTTGPVECLLVSDKTPYLLLLFLVVFFFKLKIFFYCFAL